MPDCREVSLVGAGTNVLNSAIIISHNAISAGQFQDDQAQLHEHNITNGNDGTGTRRCGITEGIVGGYSYAFRAEPTGRNPVGPPVASTSAGGVPRTGATTHGKQLGVNYQIKVLD